MAIIRNTAAMRLRGRVGNTSYYVQGRRQVARVGQNSSNYGEDARRSYKQQTNRVKWANLVNFYKVSKGWMHGAFEFKKPTQSDYNRFMQLNKAFSEVSLPKNYAESGAAVPYYYRISEGSLQQVVISTTDETRYTNIVTTINPTVLQTGTIGELSTNLIENNAFLKNGMQLTLVIYNVEQNIMLMPVLDCSALELTLDTESGQSCASNGFAARINVVSAESAKYIGLDKIGMDAWVSVILSDSTGGTLKVSTASLVPGDTDIMDAFTSEEALKTAIESYGVDSARFLDSGDMPPRG